MRTFEEVTAALYEAKKSYMDKLALVHTELATITEERGFTQEEYATFERVGAEIKRVEAAILHSIHEEKKRRLSIVTSK